MYVCKYVYMYVCKYVYMNVSTMMNEPGEGRGVEFCFHMAHWHDNFLFSFLLVEGKTTKDLASGNGPLSLSLSFLSLSFWHKDPLYYRCTVTPCILVPRSFCL